MFSSLILSCGLIPLRVQYFLAVAFVLLCGYGLASYFYRVSAREIKRLGVTEILAIVHLSGELSLVSADNFLRSGLYGHFSESLGGLATIRAYGETSRVCTPISRAEGII